MAFDLRCSRPNIDNRQSWKCRWDSWMYKTAHNFSPEKMLEVQPSEALVT